MRPIYLRPCVKWRVLRRPTLVPPYLRSWPAKMLPLTGMSLLCHPLFNLIARPQYPLVQGRVLQKPTLEPWWLPAATLPLARRLLQYPPPNQPFCFPNPFKMDNNSNASLRSKSASAKDGWRPLLTPDNNNAPSNNDVEPPNRKVHTVVITGGLGDSQPLINSLPPTLACAFEAHNHTMTAALNNVTVMTPCGPTADTATLVTIAVLMLLMTQNFHNTRAEARHDSDKANRDPNTLIEKIYKVTTVHTTLLGSINLALNLLNQKANSVEITRLEQHMETMSTTIMTSIHADWSRNWITCAPPSTKHPTH